MKKKQPAGMKQLECMQFPAQGPVTASFQQDTKQTEEKKKQLRTPEGNFCFNFSSYVVEIANGHRSKTLVLSLPISFFFPLKYFKAHPGQNN